MRDLNVASKLIAGFGVVCLFLAAGSRIPAGGLSEA